MKQESPPPTHVIRNKVDWPAVVTHLKTVPGEWYNVGTFSPAMAYHLRRGINKAFYDPSDALPFEKQLEQRWEFTSRKAPGDTNQSTLYVRYLG